MTTNSRAQVVLAAVLAVTSSACGARSGLDGSRDAAPDDAGSRLRDAGPPAVDSGLRADAALADAGPESDIGEPCGGPTECFSAGDVVDVPACIGPGVWPNGGLWEDGYCTAQCTPSSAPLEGEPLARDDCPADALCVPVEDGVGVCLLACERDGQCRMPSGFSYSCRRWFGAGSADGPVLVPVGVCMSAHCESRGCPGSARCDC